MIKSLIDTLNGQMTKNVPFWFMRQAGRYLPEYREVRKTAGGFLNLVYNPDNASEVTMQPIRRFGMNGSILFSDILVIPHALGQDLKFETGEGPKLNAIRDVDGLKILNPDNIDQTLNPIYETIRQVKSKLKSEGFGDTALIGFAGSPWTVATYMVEGGGSKTFTEVKKWAYGAPDEFQQLIDVVTDATIEYLDQQVQAGVQALQLFDSWAGILDTPNFNRWVIDPTTKIVSALREKYPHIPIIGFPREAGHLSINYIQKTGIQAVGLDFTEAPYWARKNLQNVMPVQGNLDPVYLLNGGQAMRDAATEILETFASKPFVFNLGHGVIKETPPENVAELSQLIKDFKR